MPDNRMHVPYRKYQDGTPVPYPVYRCKRQDNKPNARTPWVSDDGHKCKIVTDHTGPCKCICGKTWELTHADL